MPHFECGAFDHSATSPQRFNLFFNMLRTRSPVPNNVPIVIPTRRPYGAGALRSVAVDTQGFVQWQGATAISKSGAISIGFGSNIRLLSKSRPVTFTGSIAGKRKGLGALASPRL